MRLLDYLNNLPIWQRYDLATRCGTSFDYLRQIAYGNRQCKEALAIKLEKFTNRELTCEDLCPGVDWAFLRQGGRTGDPAWHFHNPESQLSACQAARRKPRMTELSHDPERALR